MDKGLDNKKAGSPVLLFVRLFFRFYFPVSRLIPENER